MLWPTIAKCYSKLLEDPSLLWLFSEEEGTPLQELPILGALCFRIILTHIASPVIWGKTGVEVITDASLKTSREATPMVILITDGVVEENLSMVTHLLPSWPKQNGGIRCTLHPMPVWLPWVQCGGGKKIYQYPLHSPRNLLAPLLWCQYTLQGCFLHPVPSEHLCLQRLLPYSKTKVLLLHEEGEWDLRYIPTTKRFMEKVQRGTLPLWPSVIINLLTHSPSPYWRRHSDLRRNWAMKDQATAQPFNNCRTIIRQELN